MTTEQRQQTKNMIKLKKLFALLFLAFISCGKNNAEFTIKDFDTQQSVTLEPYSLMPYAMCNLRVKGFANDTINIKTKGVYNLDMLLAGDIDTLWCSDYYGEGPIEFIFDPYKATEGELKVSIKL